MGRGGISGDRSETALQATDSTRWMQPTPHGSDWAVSAKLNVRRYRRRKSASPLYVRRFGEEAPESEVPLSPRVPGACAQRIAPHAAGPPGGWCSVSVGVQSAAATPPPRCRAPAPSLAAIVPLSARSVFRSSWLCRGERCGVRGAANGAVEHVPDGRRAVFSFEQRLRGRQDDLVAPFGSDKTRGHLTPRSHLVHTRPGDVSCRAGRSG